MRLHAYRQIFTWVKVTLVIMCLVLPFIQTVHAHAETNTQHDMEMTCHDDHCENTPAAKTCLEHCLQVTSIQSPTIFVPQRSVDINIPVKSFESSPLRTTTHRFQIPLLILTRSPDIHLATQKRE